MFVVGRAPASSLITIHRATIRNFAPVSRFLRCRPTRALSQTSVAWSQAGQLDYCDLSDLVKPIVIRSQSTGREDSIVVKELTGISVIPVRDILRILAEFSHRKEVLRFCDEKGINGKAFRMAFVSFRNFCLNSKPLPADLHVTLCDIMKKKRSVDDICAFFVEHAYKVFPHLKCYDDLKRISDVTEPQNWFPEARQKVRKIVFHCGPTNSGKTFAAMKHFIRAKTAVYCAPLRLLAMENFHKLKAMGIPIDLTTGEERIYSREDKEPSSHLSCTMEMLNTQTPFDVCVIDEAQLLADLQRGWAWTRAVLGANATEVHLCGEESALHAVENLLLPMGEIVEPIRYGRLTEPILLDTPVESFNKIQPGDAIVCFSKMDIYKVAKSVEEATGMPVAAIYGTLPPLTKIKQAERFNDPKDPCKVLVATDAIGMGVNLNIRRIVFYSLSKPTLLDGETGEKRIQDITPAQCKQIAGRAGRFGTENTQGYVTTFRKVDFGKLQHLFEAPIDPLQQAGLQVTPDVIETFSYLLPEAPLTTLIDIFYRIKDVDADKYFMCSTFDIRGNAGAIDHIRLPVVTKFKMAQTPICVTRSAYLCTHFVAMARAFASGKQVPAEQVLRSCKVSLKDEPRTIYELSIYEDTVDILDMYLWLALRFPDVFVEPDQVREYHRKLDDLIYRGLMKLCSANGPKLTRNAKMTGSKARASVRRSL